MAVDTVANDVDVVEVRRNPGGGRMAVVAIVAAHNVRRVLARRGNTVVAGRADADYLQMVNGVGRRPNDVVVAVLADIRCRNMRGILASCADAVVAVNAVADDIGMIEVGWNPGDGRVAIVAIVTAGDMVNVLSRRHVAVMTGAAGAQHLRVVNQVRRYPQIAIVAVLANVGRLNVSLALASGLNAVVAADAVAENIGMIEIGR